MASSKSILQEYAMKMHWALPTYENLNEGYEWQPSFRSFVTINGSRYESSGAFKQKKAAELSAAEVAIQAIKQSDCRFEETMGKKLLTELLVNMGIGSPTFSFTQTGVGHSLDFISTVQIGGVSYVGGVAKSKREAEIKAAVVAFQAIKEQVGDPEFLLQLQAESRVSLELKQPTEECKDIKPELKKETEAQNKDVQSLESKQPTEECKDIEPELKKETEAQNKDVQEINLKDSINKRDRSDIENCEQISGKIKRKKKEKNPRMISDSENCEQISGKIKSKKKEKNHRMISDSENCEDISGKIKGKKKEKNHRTISD